MTSAPECIDKTCPQRHQCARFIADSKNSIGYFELEFIREERKDGDCPWLLLDD